LGAQAVKRAPPTQVAEAIKNSRRLILLEAISLLQLLWVNKMEIAANYDCTYFSLHLLCSGFAKSSAADRVRRSRYKRSFGVAKISSHIVITALHI